MTRRPPLLGAPLLGFLALTLAHLGAREARRERVNQALRLPRRFHPTRDGPVPARSPTEATVETAEAAPPAAIPLAAIRPAAIPLAAIPLAGVRPAGVAPLAPVEPLRQDRGVPGPGEAALPAPAFRSSAEPEHPSAAGTTEAAVALTSPLLRLPQTFSGGAVLVTMGQRASRREELLDHVAPAGAGLVRQLLGEAAQPMLPAEATVQSGQRHPEHGAPTQPWTPGIPELASLQAAVSVQAVPAPWGPSWLQPEPGTVTGAWQPGRTAPVTTPAPPLAPPGRGAGPPVAAPQRAMATLDQLREQLAQILQDDALRHGLNLKEG